MAGWGSEQVQIQLDVQSLSDRPCDVSKEIAYRLLQERLKQKETSDAGTTPLDTSSIVPHPSTD